MKTRNFLVALLFSSAVVSAGGISVPMAPRWTSVALSTSATAPSGNPNSTLIPGVGPTAGRSSAIPGALWLSGCKGYRLSVCAANGNTLSGAGTLNIYYWPAFVPPNVALSTWPRNPGLDETVAATGQCQTFPDHPTYGLNGGWIFAAPSSVTTSAGSTVTVLTEALCAS